MTVPGFQPRCCFFGCITAPGFQPRCCFFGCMTVPGSQPRCCFFRCITVPGFQPARGWASNTCKEIVWHGVSSEIECFFHSSQAPIRKKLKHRHQGIPWALHSRWVLKHKQSHSTNWNYMCIHVRRSAYCPAPTWAWPCLACSSFKLHTHHMHRPRHHITPTHVSVRRSACRPAHPWVARGSATAASLGDGTEYKQGLTGSHQVHVWLSLFVGLARTICIRCTFGIFGLEITKCTVYIYIYVHIRFWPTLVICKCFLVV